MFSEYLRPISSSHLPSLYVAQNPWIWAVFDQSSALTYSTIFLMIGLVIRTRTDISHAVGRNASVQERNRKFFLRGQRHFFWFFFLPGVKCFFPVENYHFGRPKTNFNGFEKWKKKVLSSFCNFPSFHFQLLFLQFSFFSSPPFPPFPFFPCLLFPDRSVEISRSEVSGGHSAPSPPVTPLQAYTRR